MSAALPPPAVRSRFATCLALFMGATTCLFAQSAPAPATGAPVQTSDIVELSPFTVTTSSEKGYLATQTLNGTRLKTSLRDVGSAMTIFTDQLLDDLAANSITDLVSFAPNTDPYVGDISSTNGAGNEFLTTQTPQYVTRGGTTGLISQDFFGTPSVPPDRYNAENFTFTRGPNAILFGLGNPAGAFVSSTKRARFQNRYGVEVRADDNGGLRGSIDLNRMIVPKRFAVRYAGLFENAEGFRDPSDSTQRRHYLTALYTPFAKTSIRVNFETGKVHTMAIRPWPAYDGLSAWIDAGKPLLPLAKSANNSVRGIQAAYGNNLNQNLIYTAETPAGTPVRPMSWALQGRSAILGFPNYPVLGAGFRSLVNPDVLPLYANVIGEGTFRHLEFNSGAVFVEQQITRDLFVEAAFSRVKSDTLISSGIGGQFERLFADVNQQLPDGSPNPNVGMIYTDSFTNHLPNRLDAASQRLMVSYELDFAKLWPRHGSWLGKHRLAGMLERGDTDQWGSQNPSQNVTPLPGYSRSIIDVQNRVIFRNYIDPARGVVSGGYNARGKYPLIFADDPLPAPDPSGVTPAFVAIFGGTAAKTELTTRMIATQSTFWKDRIVVTFGVREDKQTNYRGQQADFDPYTDARGIYPDPKRFDAKHHFPGSRIDQVGHTYTKGVVFHALPWLSLSFNKSDNLQPNATLRDVSGNLLPDQQGEGEDYGLKFLFAGGRVVADLVYYKNYSLNRPDTAVSTGVHGNFQNLINEIWTAVAGVEKDTKYLDQPYAYTGSLWRDINTGYSDGYELSITTNLTPEWRLAVNGAIRSPGETQSRGALVKDYLATNLALWKANPAWMRAPLVGSTNTVATSVGELETTLASFNALADLPSDSLLSPEWSANLVTGYNFATESRLRGFAVGATANVRGKTVIGFAEDRSGVLVADHPYYAREFVTTGAWVTYRRKLFDGKIDWRLQLNVRNLFDENKVFPHRAVDARDGTNRPAIVLYRLNEPRTFLLTSAFSF